MSTEPPENASSWHLASSSSSSINISHLTNHHHDNFSETENSNSRSAATSSSSRRSRRKKDDDDDDDDDDDNNNSIKSRASSTNMNVTGGRKKEKDKDVKEKPKSSSKSKSKEKDNKEKEKQKQKDEKEKEPRNRSNRRPHDSLTTTSATTTNSASSRKKQKLDPQVMVYNDEVKNPSSPNSTHFSQPPNLLLQQPTSYSPPYLPATLPPSRPSSQPAHSVAPPPPPPFPPPQRTSGQRYDPIRGSTIENDPPPPASLANASNTNAMSPPAPPVASPIHAASPRTKFNRASESPSISSLIDPPVYQQPSFSHVKRVSSGPISSFQSPPPPAPASTLGHSPSPPPTMSYRNLLHPQTQSSPSKPPPPPPQPTVAPPSDPPKESTPAARGVSQPSPTKQKEIPQKADHPHSPHGDTAMDIDGDVNKESTSNAGAPLSPPKDQHRSNATPSPKLARPTAKEATKKLPQGSGLISNALFGFDDDSNSSRSAPNIVLHVPLDGTTNRIINFARLAEEQYGFAALHPRLAAQRERLARVAAASAALEKNEKGVKGISAGESAEEDLSVDVDRDSDVDGDIAMGGMGLGVSNGADPAATSDADGKKKKRRKKIEEYDREDPFVDDTELAWQEHAAASKDGFFVYSGPLVPDGDKVQVEKLVQLSPIFLLKCMHTNNFSSLQTRRISQTWRKGKPSQRRIKSIKISSEQ